MIKCYTNVHIHVYRIYFRYKTNYFDKTDFLLPI